MFVIVRHGNTFAAGEPPRRIGARTDLPLTDTGVAQARTLGTHFAGQGLRFVRVLVSPLTRTRQTAQAILEHQGAALVPEACDWLREIDHGPDEDQPEDVVLARIGTQALEAWDARAEPPPGWIVDAPARVAAWRALFATTGVDEAGGGATLIVTSNGAARFALLADPALAATLSNLPSLKLPTGGYGVIQRGLNDTLEVSDWGRRP